VVTKDAGHLKVGNPYGGGGGTPLRAVGARRRTIAWLHPQTFLGNAPEFLPFQMQPAPPEEETGGVMIRGEMSNFTGFSGGSELVGNQKKKLPVYVHEQKTPPPQFGCVFFPLFMVDG